MDQTKTLLAMLNRLKNSGGMGSEENHTAKLPFWREGAPDVEIFGMPFAWCSPLMPTREDVYGGTCTMIIPGQSSVNCPILQENEIFADESGFCGQISVLREKIPFLVTYRAGAVETEFNGQAITINYPKAGIYMLMTEDLSVASLELKWSTVYPIDKKFLPDECTPAVVDLTKYPTTGGVQDGISVNDQVLYMVNASMTYGGAVQEATIELNDTSLAKDLAAGPSVIIKATAYMIDTGKHFDTYYPATVSIKQETKLCSNAHCYSTLNLNGLVSVECCFVFFTSSTSMTISLKATPWA